MSFLASMAQNTLLAPLFASAILVLKAWPVIFNALAKEHAKIQLVFANMDVKEPFVSC